MPINFNKSSSEGGNIHSKSEENVSNNSAAVSFKAIEPIFGIDEVILSDDTLEEIKTVVNSRKNWDKVFIQWNMKSVLKQRKNLFVNLYGAPGTGKTMAAHAIAKETGLKIICVNYADIESKYVGETSKNLVNLFETAAKENVIIFFDEADALLSKRVTNMSSSTDVSVNQTRSVLLTLLNDYTGMIIFATNFISNFDSAFMRRIQFHVKFDLPNEKMRRLLWEKYIPDKMPTDIRINELAEKYSGLSGSDISTAVMKAALKAANDGLDIVPHIYFEEAVKNIIESQNANKQDNYIINQKEISKEDAMEQLKGINEKESIDQ